MRGSKGARYDWNEVQRFHDRGHGRDACVEQFGFTIGAWYKAIRFRRLRAPLQRPSVDWAAVQVYYDGGHTYRECRARFGFAAASWTKAVRRGALRARRNRWPLMKVLGQAKNRRTVKQHLFAAGLLENVCSVCGLSEWQGKPLVIQLDHINGVRNDHRLENLRMLCPNCHSQTDTFAARNKARRVRTF